MSEILTKYKLSSEKASLSRGKAKRNGESILRVETKDKSLALDKIIQSRVNFLEEKIQLEKEQAYRSGFEDGKEIMREEEEKVIQLFLSLIEELKNQREDYLKSVEKEMVGLSLEIASKVIQQKIEQDEKVILKNLKHALKHLLDKGRIIIRLNPADLEIVSKHSKEIKSAEGLKELILEEDSKVTRGGCLIHSELGHIDAQIETQLEMIGKALLEIN
ncbi:MAG: FliH/SctL family protein [candidate division Zixibacteria bacterium]|nr:FliH/SctL family protein [candidate division Zixibacteria bacterium]